MSRALPPSLADRFEVLGELGRGSFGRVLDVRDRSGARRALKVLEGDLDLQRLGRELKASQAIRHPHVLEVHEVGLVDGVGYLLMDRANGTLQDWITEPARAPQAWEALRQVASGLAALHAEGIVHRDLKPENVMLVGGEARVGDLGLAKGGDLRTLTRTGWVMGTPAYMAPEQARGEPLTPAADVFALGVMLFEVATGQLPYPSTTPRRLLPSLARGGPLATGEIPPELPEVVRACLDPDPARRPSAASLARDLGPPPRRAAPAAALAAPTRRLPREQLPTPGGAVATPAGGVAARSMTTVGGRGLLGVGLLAVLVAAVLTSVGRPPSRALPPEKSEESAAATEPGWPAALGPDYAARLRRALERAKESFLDEAGAVHTLDEVVGSPPEGWVPLLPEDPARFSMLVENVPELAAWYRWVGEGGAVEALPEAVRLELRELDARFRREQQPEPFAPWLDLEPAPAPVGHDDLFAGEPDRPPPGSLAGWSGTTVERIRRGLAAKAEATAAVVGYFEGRETSFPGADLEDLGLRSAYHLDSPLQAERMVDNLDEYLATGPWRARLQDWYRGYTTEVTAMTYAGARALREHPEHAPALVPLLDLAYRDLGDGRYGGWWGLPEAALTGGTVAPPLGPVLRALLGEQRLRTQREFGRFLLPLHTSRERLWADALEGPGQAALRAQPWYPWLVRVRMRTFVKTDPPWQELEAMRARYAAPLSQMAAARRAEVLVDFAAGSLRAEPPAPDSVLRRYQSELVDLAANLRAEDLGDLAPEVLHRLQAALR